MRHPILNATLIAALGITASSPLYADFIGFKVGAYNWSQDYDGEIQSSSDILDEIDLNNDLGLKEEDGNTYYLALEHPIPIIPNIRIQQTDLEIKETSNPTRSFSFDDQTFVVTDDITTTSDLSHTDATLYYELLDNWISIDFGLTIRQFSEGVELRSNTTGAELEIDEAIPMLYLAAEVELPLTGLYVAAEVNGLGTGDASLIDYKATIGYESGIGLGVEAGLRSFEIDYDDDDEQANLTIDGIFAGVFYHF